MKFDIITIFPEIFDSYFSESIINRAQQKRLIKIGIHNLRDYTRDKHKTVDDKPFGGGPGMVMMVGPIFKAVQALKKQFHHLEFTKHQVDLTSLLGLQILKPRQVFLIHKLD